MTPVQTTKMSNFRWVICGLLFLATTINYMDRQVLSLTINVNPLVLLHMLKSHSQKNGQPPYSRE